MVHAVRADRAEQRTGKAAMTATADHEQIRARRRVDQDLRRATLLDPCANADVTACGVYVADRLGHHLLRDLAVVNGLNDRYRYPCVASHGGWILPRDHGFDRAASEPSLPDSPSEGSQRGRRTVHSSHNAGDSAITF
jgi:hypothetical protein